MGVLAGVANGFLMGWLSRTYDEETLRWWSARLMAAALLAWGVLVRTIPGLLVVLAPLGLCGTIFVTPVFLCTIIPAHASYTRQKLVCIAKSFFHTRGPFFVCCL